MNRKLAYFCIIVVSHQVANGSLYFAETGAGAGFDLISNVFFDRNSGDIRGTGQAIVDIQTGATSFITLQKATGTLESATWTGSGTIINTTTLQPVDVSFEIVTEPTSFSITTTQAIPLSPNATGGLEWDRGGPGIPGEADPFRLAGTYTLRGPSETATGSFEHFIGSREILTSGLLTPTNFPDEFQLNGGVNGIFPGTFTLNRLTLIDDVVDGVRITAQTDGIRSGVGVGFNETTFVPVPEPSSILLTIIGLSSGFFKRARH